jgi:hypothetical protein
MSVFKRKDSPYYWWKLQYKGEKFSKSTTQEINQKLWLFFLKMND